MNKLLRRVLVLVVAFAAGLGIVFWVNRQREETDISYLQTQSSTLPTLSFTWRGEEINRQNGYVQTMNAAAMQDYMLPVEGDRLLSFTVYPGAKAVKSMSYEVRSALDSHLVENGAVADVTSLEDRVDASVRLGELMLEQEEYFLRITVTLDDGQEVYFYNRLIYQPAGSVLAQLLPFAAQFSARTFDKEAMYWFGTYMEPDSSIPTTLGHTTIKSTRNQVTWGGLAPVRGGDVRIQVQRVSEKQASIILLYYMEATGYSGETQRFSVREFLCLRYIRDTIYLMSYDRQTSELLRPENAAGSASIRLGLQPGGDTAAKSLGSRTVFEVAGDLWQYDSSENGYVRIYSASAGSTDLRYLSGRHSFRIIDLDADGNVTFLVCGYQGRGTLEGRSGLAFYRYTRADNTLAELLFIPSDRPYENMERELDELFCIGKNGQIYMLFNDSLYSLDLVGYEPVEIAKGLADGQFAVNADQTMIAWTEGGDEKGGSSICLMTLTDGYSWRKNANEGEKIRPMAFLGTDFIYGLVRTSDMTGTEEFFWDSPAYALEISSKEGTLLEHYERNDYYISGVTVGDGRIALHRKWRDEDGAYWAAEGDTLISLSAQSTSVSSLVRETSENGRPIWEVTGTGKPAEKSVKVEIAMQKKTPGTAELQLTAKSAAGESYLGYAGGELVYAGSYPAAAIRTAYESSGYVVSLSGPTVWERGGLVDYRYIRRDTEIVAADESDRKRAAVSMLLKMVGAPTDTSLRITEGMSTEEALKASGAACVVKLEGTNVQEILYYLDRGIPVLVLAPGDHAEIITGFDYRTINCYDPVEGAGITRLRDEAQGWYQSNGSRFLVVLN